MNKKFILIVKHQSGKATMLTDTPDLLKAIQEYSERVSKLFGTNKDNMIPQLISAEIVPLIYDNLQGGINE